MMPLPDFSRCWADIPPNEYRHVPMECRKPGVLPLGLCPPCTEAMVPKEALVDA